MTIHDHAAEASLFKRRALFTFACVIVMLGILLTNLYHLQIEDYKNFSTRSNENRIRVVPVPPSRGLIFDRNGQLLAENRPFYSLQVLPEKVKSIDETLAKLKSVIPLSDDEIESFKESLKYHRRFKPLALKNRLTQEQVAEFSVNQYKFSGVYVDAGLKRFYPQGELLTHVLGYVGKINPKDQDRLEQSDEWKNYAATKDIGKRGIERYYESLLHGKPGHLEEEVNNRGRTIRTLNSIPPVPGQDIYLTIDLDLQKKAMELLDGRRGTIVAIDPRDAGVLAMASSPSYDPNQFVHGISSKAYRALLNDKNRPLINRATQGQYSPASTIKPIMALAGLEDKVVTEHTRIWDPGFWQIPNVEHKYRDWKRWGHGWVDVHDAIIDSCDTYFYELAYKLGVNRIAQFMAPFGFGESTGIDIFEESTGNLPDKEWKQIKYEQPWYIGDTISVGIGQGYWTATPIQLAKATTIVANHGKRYVPHLLKSLQDTTSNIAAPIDEMPPIKLNNEHNWDIVNDSMYRTAEKKRFKKSPYNAAMKTGTAQIVSIAQDKKYDAKSLSKKHRDNALIVAYAPYEDPKIVVSVVLENAGWGGDNAGPVAKGMLDAYLLNPDGSLKQ